MHACDTVQLVGCEDGAPADEVHGQRRGGGLHRVERSLEHLSDGGLCAREDGRVRRMGTDERRVADGRAPRGHRYVGRGERCPAKDEGLGRDSVPDRGRAHGHFFCEGILVDERAAAKPDAGECGRARRACRRTGSLPDDMGHGKVEQNAAKFVVGCCLAGKPVWPLGM